MSSERWRGYAMDEPSADASDSGYHRSPFRSCLSVPAAESRKMRRALESAADLVIIDLEDSVPQAGKQAARSSMAATLSGGAGAQELSRPIAVRVNALRSRWFLDDVLAVADLGAVSGIVVPKVGSAADLYAVDAVLDSAEAAAGPCARAPDVRADRDCCGPGGGGRDSARIRPAGRAHPGLRGPGGIAGPDPA